jgi:Fic family protein
VEAIEKAEQLKAELDSLRPLDAEREARVLQKLRLDWNYHSNNLEGNSLTSGETRALILFGITAQGKPLKDHFEITGHDEAIKWVEELVKGEAPLTEKFIRELHVLLLKEDHYVDALTSEGTPTRRRVQVGKYKTQPNHVLTKTGEMFYFSTPEDTPAKTQELIEWFRSEKEKPDVNPIILASLFHYRFIRIHPFDDGNGRVVRILMNFILMQYGYPPVIIKTEDKENYYGVLQLADAGELESFTEYIADNLVYSLGIMIRGAKGEDIDEPEDLDKELALLDQKLNSIGEKANKVKSDDTFVDFIENSLVPFVVEFSNTCKKFQRFYLSSDVSIILNPAHFVSSIYPSEKITMDLSLPTEDIFAELIRNILDYLNKKNISSDRLFEIECNCIFTKFNRLHHTDVNYSSSVYFYFQERIYSTISDDPEINIQKVYGKYLSKNEITEICKKIAKKHMNFLESEIAN